jgi:DNA-binding ferritin-like protein
MKTMKQAVKELFIEDGYPEHIDAIFEKHVEEAKKKFDIFAELLGIKGSTPSQEASAKLDKVLEEAEFFYNQDELYSRIAKAFSKYLKVEDVEALTVFARTTNGKKAIQSMPKIIQEVEKAIAKYTQEIFYQAEDYVNSLDGNENPSVH